MSNCIFLQVRYEGTNFLTSSAASDIVTGNLKKNKITYLIDENVLSSFSILHFFNYQYLQFMEMDIKGSAWEMAKITSDDKTRIKVRIK